MGHLRAGGYAVRTEDLDDLAPVKRKLGVPSSLQSCHTAVVEGYVIEGHVPASDIERLVAERPDAIGLTVPGMPQGSPGMEQADGKTEAYDVLLIKKDGTTEIFASH